MLYISMVLLKYMEYINLFDNHKIDRRLQDYCSIGDCKFSQTAYFKV